MLDLANEIFHDAQNRYYSDRYYIEVDDLHISYSAEIYEDIRTKIRLDWDEDRCIKYVLNDIYDINIFDKDGEQLEDLEAEVEKKINNLINK